MKKNKIFATLLAGALVAASAASLAACGGVSMPKGDEVSKTEWEEFIYETLELENYTVEYSVESKSTLKGTYSELNYNTQKKKDHTVDSSDIKISMSGLVLYDKKGDKAYTEGTTTSKLSGVVDGEKAKTNSEGTTKAYYEASEKKDDTQYYWKTVYSSSEYNSEDVDGKDKSSEENYWEAKETSSFTTNPAYAMLQETTFYESDKEDAEAKDLSDLYDKFTYSKGVYTATLYRKANISEQFNLKDVVECTVSVSFNKAEKCVIGYGIKAKGEDNLKYESPYGDYNFDYTYEAESVYAISKIKETDVSKKVNKDITKAIDKAKDEKKENA